MEGESHALRVLGENMGRVGVRDLGASEFPPAGRGNLSSKFPPSQAVGLAAAPDGSQIAEAGGDMRFLIRYAQTLKVNRELRTHDAPLTVVAWHPSLPCVATASEDRRVKIWDLRTDNEVKKIVSFVGVPSNLLWSPDGKTRGVLRVGESYFVDLFKIDAATNERSRMRLCLPRKLDLRICDEQKAD